MKTNLVSKLFDELFENPIVIIISLVGWGIVCLMMWKFQFLGSQWSMWQKIGITIALLPIIFVVTNFQLNR